MNPFRSLPVAASGCALLALSLLAPALLHAEDSPHAHHDHGSMQPMAEGGDDPHAHHRAMMQQEGYKRSEQQVAVPALELVDMQGQPVAIDALLAEDGPVMLTFIFTTCTTICPVLSATFSQVQQQLGPEAADVRLISVSIDPEQDTPEQLRIYAKRYKAGDNWQFLTGQLGDIIAVQEAFDAYRGDKMNHEPLTFIRTAADAPWVRLEGFASASEIIAEYKKLL
jgi:protein SCO1/2